MRKLEKKLIVSFISVVILISGLTTVSAVTIEKENPNIKDDEPSLQTETVTLYRFGLDGSLTPVEVEVELKEGQDLNDAIEEKCVELLENDPEFQESLDDNTTMGALSIVKSRGRGLHLKLRPSIQWPIKYKLFPMLPPYVFRRVHIPIVYCKYTRDDRALTTITPLSGEIATTVEGPHSVLCIGFYGFKWWAGHVSLLGFGLRTGFVGISIITKVNKF